MTRRMLSGPGPVLLFPGRPHRPLANVAGGQAPAADVPPPVPPERNFQFAIPPGLHPRRLWALSRFIRAGGYDIVHTHNWSSMFYGVLAGRLAGRPLILHGEHGLNFEDLRGPGW